MKKKKTRSEINYEAVVRCLNQDCDHCPLMESTCDFIGAKFGYIRLPMRLISDIKSDEGYRVPFDNQ